ncbi:MAG: hypothetical protein SNI51_01740 [Rikenellaceae bacterium]
MKEFDINTIGKEMPYKAPNSDFFENFTEELLNKVEQKPKPRLRIISQIAPFCGIAAAVAVVLAISINLTSNDKWSSNYIISENLDESLDSYFASLSDEELASLVAESSYHDDFYSTLPNN